MTDHSPHRAHRVRKPETDFTIGDSTTTVFWKCRNGGNTACADPVLRVLVFDGSPQSIAMLLLAVEREISPFDLVFHLQVPGERHSGAAEAARALHIAVSAGVPVLRVTADPQPAEAVALKVREILGCPAGSEIPGGVVELAMAASLDDLHLATASEVPFMRHCFPLLDLGWGHRECQAYLRSLRQENTTRARRLRRGWSL